MKTIYAVYENGVFIPTEPVDLPEHCAVVVEPYEPGVEAVAADEDPVTEALNRIHGEGKESAALDPLLARAQTLTLKRKTS